MNLTVETINDLRNRLKNFDEGKLDRNDLNAALNVYTQIGYQMNLYLKAYVIGMKTGQVLDGDLLEQIAGGNGNKIKKVKKLEDRTAKRGT